MCDGEMCSMTEGTSRGGKERGKGDKGRGKGLVEERGVADNAEG